MEESPAFQIVYTTKHRNTNEFFFKIFALAFPPRTTSAMAVIYAKVM